MTTGQTIMLILDIGYSGIAAALTVRMIYGSSNRWAVARFWWLRGIGGWLLPTALISLFADNNQTWVQIWIGNALFVGIMAVILAGIGLVPLLIALNHNMQATDDKLDERIQDVLDEIRAHHG